MEGLGLLELARLALDEAVAAGASYADARTSQEDHETIDVQDQHVEGVGRGESRGVGVRVVADGAWGFAATVRLDAESVRRAAREAVAVARAAATARRTPVRLAEHEPQTGVWVTPHEVDPFTVALEAKLELLLATTAAAKQVAELDLARASFDAWRTRTWFVSSEGAELDQTIVQVAAGAQCIAIGEGEVQVRSFPNSFRGACDSGGWERVTALRLPELAPGYAEQSVALLTAPELPEQTGTLVLDGSQAALQVHESVGHPLELDRIFGWEAAYAGRSFVHPADPGSLRYGSELVNLTLDSTTPHALGSFAWDDEGVPAQRTPLVVGGVLRDFLTSRETAAELGRRSNGTMRAQDWSSLPLIRMSNIHLEAGEGSFADLLADTGDGVYLETNRSWSIDDRRVNFQFACEVAFEIRGGELGRMYRNPTYQGRTTEFWGSCDRIAGPEEWRVYGTPNCGKGQPGQVARVAHGAAPVRFRDVRMGVR